MSPSVREPLPVPVWSEGAPGKQPVAHPHPSRRKPAAVPVAARRPPTTVPPGRAASPAPAGDLFGPSPADPRAASQAIMAALDGLRPAPDGTERTTYLGRVVTMTPAQADRWRATVRSALLDAAEKARIRAQDAVNAYSAQDSVDQDFPVVSRAVKGWNWATQWFRGDYEPDPSDEIYREQWTNSIEHGRARSDIMNGDFRSAATRVSAMELRAARMNGQAHHWSEQLIAGAGSVATTLEYTSKASAIAVGGLAIVVTGGAVLGLAPEVIGTGVGGLSLGATTTALTVGAPIIANVGRGLVAAAYGEKVDWTNIAVDTAVQIVLAKVGGRLTAGIFGRLAGNPAVAGLARKAAATVVSGVATHELSQAFSATVDLTVKGLRGHRDVTWDAFAADLEQRLSDPAGLFMAVAGSTVHAVGSVRVSRAAATAASPSLPVTEPVARPTTEPPTRATTRPPTEPVTHPSTEPAAPAPTEPAAHVPTEPATHAPTEPAAHVPTEPAAPAPAKSVKAVSAPRTRTPLKPKAPARPAGVANRRPPSGSGGSFGPRRTSSFTSEEIHDEIYQAGRRASIADRALAEHGTRVDDTPIAGGGRRPPSPSGAPHWTEEPGAMGDLENGLPTGVIGEVGPEHLNQGTSSASDVNPPGQQPEGLATYGADRGHLGPKAVGASGRDLRNLVWEHEVVNRGLLGREYEGPIRDELSKGNRIRFGVRPIFREGEDAPYELEVWANTTDGREVVPLKRVPTAGMSDVVRGEVDLWRPPTPPRRP